MADEPRNILGRPKSFAAGLIALASFKVPTAFLHGAVCVPTPKPQRFCLNCGKERFHNNSFCSRECCHAWRER